jgi:hypothetical protein
VLERWCTVTVTDSTVSLRKAIKIRATLVLMVYRGSGLPEEDSCAPILKLSVEDSADMLELTAMTKPGALQPAHSRAR